MLNTLASKVGLRTAALAAAAVMAASLSFPALAFAKVTIDETVINQGENSVGGGTATLTDTVLDMVNVVANTMETDQDLIVNFNGGNDIDDVYIRDSAEVTANFSGENEVEDFRTKEDASLTINANGHNDFEDIEAENGSNVTINVTGENDFDRIVGRDEANITIRGTNCQKKDIVNIEDDDMSKLEVAYGNLTIDHVTVNLAGPISCVVGAIEGEGNVIVDTSKIKAEDDANTTIHTGGTMLIRESVIEIAGEVSSDGVMTINHSDVKVEKPKSGNIGPYRVYSREDIELIDEENGEVRDGEIDGVKVRYVDTDDNDGSDVDLKADGEPGYYKCKSSKGMPKTGDKTIAPTFALLAIASFVTVACVGRRRREGML